MKPSDQIINFISFQEGFRDTAYRPLPTDRWTLGYGSTFGIDGNPVREGDTITETQAKQLLEDSVNNVSARLNEFLGDSVIMTQNQYDAIISLCYNIGVSAFSNSHTGQMCRNGDNISSKFEVWIYSGGVKVSGLLNRRILEKQIYDTGVYP